MKTAAKVAATRFSPALLAILVGATFLGGCGGGVKQIAPADMVFVDGGTFKFGSSNPAAPGSLVTLRNFYIGKFEITFEEYDFFCKETNRPRPSDSGWGRDRMPASNVSWWDAVEFANWRSEKAKLQKAYIIEKATQDPSTWKVTCDFLSDGFRLPTEAEWEYAAKGGKLTKGTEYAGGEAADINSVGSYLLNSQKQPYDVGKKAPNELQAFDMSGNLEEWCWDIYSADPKAERYEPLGPSSGNERTLRGGSWFDPDFQLLKVTARKAALPLIRKDYIGFRLARTIPDSILVGGGSFSMGSSSYVDREAQPVHAVSVGSFYMSKYETTFDEYDTFCDETGKPRVSDEGFGRGKVAAINVSWYDAVEYANWKSRKDGFNPCYSISKSPVGLPSVTWDTKSAGYRLPTEAEWEYAARGGSASGGYAFAGTNGLSSDGRLDKFGWYSFTFKEDLAADPFDPAMGKAHEVTSRKEIKDMGSKKGNELGIYGLSGNAAEWCWDYFGAYDPKVSDNPSGPATGTARVVRGGSWASGMEMLRTTFRSSSAPEAVKPYNGIRLVRNAR